MNQYHRTVNLDKREFLCPHTFGDGLKLREQTWARGGIMSALHILLAGSSGYGDGDYDEAGEIVGRWCGDRIVIAGNHADDADWETKEEDDPPSTVFVLCGDGTYTDISQQVAPLVERYCKVRFSGKCWRKREPVGAN